MGACLPNLEALIAAGINPKTKLPYKFEIDNGVKDEIKKQLRILDEQNAVNRYTWYNLPCNITSQELERLLYYRGQLCFFYHPELENFFFMPYALDGTIDFYGRYNTVHPVPFASGTEEDKKVDKQKDLLSTIKLDVIYSIPGDDEKIEQLTEKFLSGKACLLVHDYTKQLSQTIISRQIIQEPILDVMANCIPYLDTCLLANTGVKGMRVSNEGDYPNVLDANAAFKKAALSGKPYIPIVGTTEFQDLAGTNALRAEEYLLAMQGLDNYRLSLYGLENGGLFQKKSHMLEAEQKMNAGKAAIPLQDGLTIRQNFCDILNTLTQLGVSCEIGESVLGVDENFDGVSVTEQEQSGIPGQQEEIISEETL